MTDWMLNSSLNEWIQSTIWAWPLFETLHFFGLAMMLGGLIFIDLRMVGWFKGMSMTSLHEMLPFLAAGFAINLITGVLFVFGDPERYLVHGGFQLKLLLIVLAGLNVGWYSLRIAPSLEGVSGEAAMSLEAKIVGTLSLLFWFVVLVLGRLIPYVSTG